MLDNIIQPETREKNIVYSYKSFQRSKGTVINKKKKS